MAILPIKVIFYSFLSVLYVHLKVKYDVKIREGRLILAGGF